MKFLLKMMDSEWADWADFRSEFNLQPAQRRLLCEVDLGVRSRRAVRDPLLGGAADEFRFKKGRVKKVGIYRSAASGAATDAARKVLCPHIWATSMSSRGVFPLPYRPNHLPINKWESLQLDLTARSISAAGSHLRPHLSNNWRSRPLPALLSSPSAWELSIAYLYVSQRR